MEKTLYLRKMGCDFVKSDPLNVLSDVGNYRVNTGAYNVVDKSGRALFVEFGHWERYRYRKVNKRTGALLKKEVRELVNKNAIVACFQYEKVETGKNGRPYMMTYGAPDLELLVDNANIDYTIAGILKAVNMISADHYTAVKFI